MKKLIIFIMIFAVALSSASCGKKENIGYDPQMPQEWYDQIEEAENSPTKEIVRTGDFAGIWQNEITGEYYHLYGGNIYLVERPDASEEEVEDWGVATMVQRVDRKVADEYMLGGFLERIPDDELDLYYDSMNKTENVEKVVVMENDRTKVITETGREITFRFIQKVTGYPAGIETEYGFDY